MSGLRVRNIQDLLETVSRQQVAAAEETLKPPANRSPPPTPAPMVDMTTPIKSNPTREAASENTPQITVRPKTTTKTTAHKRTSKKEPPPDQKRIDSFFKSASKTYVVQARVDVKQEVASTSKKSTSTTRKTKKGTPPKRRKLEFPDDDTQTSSAMQGNHPQSSKDAKSTVLWRRRKAAQNAAPSSPEITIDLCSDSEKGDDTSDESSRFASSRAEQKSSPPGDVIPFVSIPSTMYVDSSHHLMPATYLSKDSPFTAQAPNLADLFPNGSDWTEKEMDSMLEKGKNYALPKKPRKPCPSYKVVRGTSFAVDAFQFGDIPRVTHYFLTHFHSDHYVGLTKKFCRPLYMSRITANLVQGLIGVDPQYIFELPLNHPVMVLDVEVTALEANHCPGAVMLVFKLPTGECYLHTGDFRANFQMESEPYFWNNNIDLIYLDTTYLNSKSFCTQYESIEVAKGIINRFRITHAKKRILFVIGAYLIGKERFWSALANEYGLSVWVEENRRRALNHMGEQEFLERLVDNPQEANLHVIAMGKISYWPLSEYFTEFEDTFDCMLALRPSGWEKPTTGRARMLAKINVVGIQYSEHSSATELERFVRFLKPKEVISTVPLYASDLHETPKVPEKWYKYDKLQAVPRNYQPSITSYLQMRMESKRNIRMNIRNTVVRPARLRRTNSTPALTSPVDLSIVTERYSPIEDNGEPPAEASRLAMSPTSVIAERDLNSTRGDVTMDSVASTMEESTPRKEDVLKEENASPPSKDVKISPASQNVKASPPSKDVKTSPPSKDVKTSPPSKDVKTSPASKEYRVKRLSLRKRDSSALKGESSSQALEKERAVKPKYFPKEDIPVQKEKDNGPTKKTDSDPLKKTDSDPLKAKADPKKKSDSGTLREKILKGMPDASAGRSQPGAKPAGSPEDADKATATCVRELRSKKWIQNSAFGTCRQLFQQD